MAGGSFEILGRPIDLAGMRCPLFLLAARDDDVVASEQIFATAHLVDPRNSAIERATAPCGHLGHGYHDADRICEELKAAGFDAISIDVVDARSKASSPLDPAIAYCQGTPLKNEIEARNGSSLEDATRHAAKALAERFGASAVDGRIRGIVITAIH